MCCNPCTGHTVRHRMLTERPSLCVYAHWPWCALCGPHLINLLAGAISVAETVLKPEFEDRRYTPKERIESQLLIHSGSCIYVHTHVLYQTWIASIE